MSTPAPRMFQTFRRHPVLTTAFVLFAALALVFLVNIVSSLIYWPLHQDEPIRPWMTVGYIGRSWDVPPPEIDRLADLPRPVKGHPFTLDEIARQRGVPVADVIAEVQAAVEQIRASRPQP